MTTVVLAEKPSVARDIAAVLGATKRGAGYFEGAGFRVTWALGHLVGLGQPADIDASWRRWDFATLPMLPDRFPLVPRQNGIDQLRILERLLTAKQTTDVVCATDAGREGELIFRWIYEITGCQKPVRRLWISSLTPDAIRKGFRELRPSEEFDNLAAAAWARSISDWLVGMNLSRAYTLASDENLHVGRVKTPTLAMIVVRDLAIEQFEPQNYREVEARFLTEVGEVVATYVHASFNGEGKPELNARLPGVGEPVDEATDPARVLARAKSGAAVIKHVEEKTETIQPPLLFDLTELQRVANRIWDWTAQRTLDVAQELYEKEKLLSYPRTDSRHLPASVAATLGPLVARLRGGYEAALVAETGSAPLSKRFVNDGEVTDHHAIIPTGVSPSHLRPGSDAALLFDLVCRRFLSAWQPTSIEADTHVELAIAATDGTEDRYLAKGKAILRQGWRALDLTGRSALEGAKGLPGGLRKGLGATVSEVRVLNKQTRPPKHFNEATLLSAMESAGASLGGELSEAMRERGLGTPATRAQMIEELVAKGYVVRGPKRLVHTPLALEFIRRVHPDLATPALTGEWESRLRKIERGADSADALLADVAEFVTATVEHARATAVAMPSGARRRPVEQPAARPSKRAAAAARRGAR
jgi:DNA topoisomerase-3